MLNPKCNKPNSLIADANSPLKCEFAVYINHGIHIHSLEATAIMHLLTLEQLYLLVHNELVHLRQVLQSWGTAWWGLGRWLHPLHLLRRSWKKERGRKPEWLSCRNTKLSSPTGHFRLVFNCRWLSRAGAVDCSAVAYGCTLGCVCCSHVLCTVTRGNRVNDNV